MKVAETAFGSWRTYSRYLITVLLDIYYIIYLRYHVDKCRKVSHTSWQHSYRAVQIKIRFYLRTSIEITTSVCIIHLACTVYACIYTAYIEVSFCGVSRFSPSQKTSSSDQCQGRSYIHRGRWADYKSESNHNTKGSHVIGWAFTNRILCYYPNTQTQIPK